MSGGRKPPQALSRLLHPSSPNRETTQTSCPAAGDTQEEQSVFVLQVPGYFLLSYFRAAAGVQVSQNSRELTKCMVPDLGLDLLGEQSVSFGCCGLRWLRPISCRRKDPTEAH